MSFGTFLLYFVLSIVVIVVGYFRIRIILAFTAVGVMSGSDGLEQWKTNRGTKKWDKIESELDDD